MNGVRILLLGPPEIQADGEILAVTRRSTRALIFYLASRGSFVGRDELLALLWGNEPEKTARRRLRETLSRLRGTFPNPDLIQADTSLVGLDFSQVYVDQLEFQSLADQAGQLPWQIPLNEPLPLRTTQLLQKAARLWRSPHFMAGARLPSSPGLDEWLINTSNKLEALAERLTLRLSDHAAATGDVEYALHLARQALAVDELSDNLQFHFLQLLVAAGRRKEAVRHFEYVERLFQRELEAAPSLRMVELYEQLKKERKRHSSQGPSIVWRPRPSVHVPFTGRKAILSQLHLFYRQGGGVFIFGEAGQGKTRLLQEFSGRLDPLPRILLTTCRQAESNLPFQPLIELLRHHIQPKEWQTLSGVWASHLSLLLPELSGQRPERERIGFELAVENTPTQVRSLLMEAIRQTLLHISQNRRLLMILDDAHWSDDSTLAAIAYLLERPPFDQQALMLLSCRIEGKNDALEATLTALRQSNRANTILLDRLNPAEMGELAALVLGQMPSDEFLYRLARETGGNTLFVLESLRSILDQAAYPNLDQSSRLPTPRSLKTIIHARLEQLSPIQRDILDTAAVVGTDFDPQVIAEVCQLPFKELANYLETLQERHLIEPLNQDLTQIQYSFIHSMVREDLYHSLNPLRRLWLHQQVAHALEKKLQPYTYEQAAVLARHYDAGGDQIRAFEYWVQAARRAHQLFSPAEATQAFIQAEKLIPLIPQLTEVQLHDLYTGWTEVAYANDDAATIQRINAELQNLGWERNSLLLLGTALDGLSDACMVANQFEEGLAYTNQAIGYLEKSSHIYEQMNAYNNRGVFLYMLNRVEESIESFQDALSLGSQSDDPHIIQARANAHYQTSIARTLTGWPTVGLRHGLLSESSYAAINRPNATAYNATALARYFLGQYHQARLDGLAGIELAQRQQAWRMLGYLHSNCSISELALGNLDASVEHAERAVDLGQKYQHPEITAFGFRALGDLYFCLEDYRSAYEYYARGMQSCQDQFLLADHSFRVGYSQALSGEPEAGLEEINQAIQSAEEMGIGLVSLFARLAKARIHILNNEWEAASQLSLVLQDEAERRSLPLVQAESAQDLGEIALHSEDFPAARVHFRTAAKIAERLNQPWLELRVLTGQMEGRRASGKPALQLHPRMNKLIERIAASTSSPSIRESLQSWHIKLTKL